MKLAQFFLPGKGRRVGVVRGDQVLDITSAEEGVRTALDLVTQGKTAQGMTTRADWLTRRLRRRPEDWREIQRPPSRRAPHLLVPIDAPEVWGCAQGGSTAAPQSKSAPGLGDPYAELVPVPREGERRPAIYFKTTAHRVVGPHAPIVIRRDSALTVPGPSLAAVLGPAGNVVAFTACNDVTARDIERTGPDFLGQAKIYGGSCALGPCLVTADEIEDPGALQVRCSIVQREETVFTEAARIDQPRVRFDGLIEWLCRDNPVPAGTVLFVGTELRVPDNSRLSEGDRVDIEVQGVGRLSNPVRNAKGAAATP